MPAAAPSRPERRITTTTKVVFSLGDHTVNIALAALTLLYIRFLTDVAHFSGTLAGLIPWIGRIVDAFTDPAMGRISDRTHWRSGRRRPYMLIGCVPFGLSFALLWVAAPFASDAARFAYYASAYVAMSLAMTVLSVPYLALIPEMSRNYDERTSLNTYRAAFGIVSVFVVIGMSEVAKNLGDNAAAWSSVGVAAGVWLCLPWLAVYRATWERPVHERRPPMGLREGMRVLARHPAYRNLTFVYIAGRTAVDVVSAMFFYYVAWVVGRREDFEPVMATFLVVVLVVLPGWLRLAQRFDKRVIYIAGVLWWVGAQVLIALGGPDWPRWSIFAVAALAGVGYAVADLMPWAMLPDAIDEDELRTGERREGLYNGTFTFVRKLSGASAVLLIGVLLDVSGYNGEARTQPASAIGVIRVLMAVVPSVLLLVSAWIARGYPLSREAHADILRQLEARRS